MYISLPFNKSCEGGNTVSNEVIGLAEDIQVNLSSVWTQTDHFHLQTAKQHILLTLCYALCSVLKIKSLSLTFPLKSF